MISALLLGALAVAQAPAEAASAAIFACSYVKNEKSDPDNHVVDLRAERRRGSDGETWVLDFPDGLSVSGKAFDSAFGSIGGGTGIEWRDTNGKARKAFVSYSDIVSGDGQETMFMSLDKPSLWQPPGYVCQTAALKESRP